MLSDIASVMFSNEALVLRYNIASVLLKLQEARQESKMLEKELVEVKDMHEKEMEASAQRIKGLQAENAQMASKVEESASRGVLPEENDDRNGKGGANSKFWKVSDTNHT
jgi:predicted nuclease with TOPRIM domain